MNSSHAWKGVFIFTTFSLLSTPIANAAGPLPTDIVASINQERTSRGLNALRIDQALSQAAQSRSGVLAEHGRIFHVTAPKDTPWPEISQVGYSYSFAGENLALGIETPEDLAARWMASPTHRENILEAEFEDIGVGVTMGHYEGRVVSYVVSYYAKKKTGTAVAPVNQATPVNSSLSTISVSAVPVKAVKKTRVVSPVLSSKYTLETLPPAIPVSVTSTEEEEVRVIERIISLFDSYLRAFLRGRI